MKRAEKHSGKRQNAAAPVRVQGSRGSGRAPEFSLKECYTTALVIIPPNALWEQIQAIRRVHDRQIDRWMPHICLVFPFVAKKGFELVCEKLMTRLDGFEAFEISFAKLDYFEHNAKIATVWASPDSSPPNALHVLHEVCHKAVPVPKQHDGPFRPHLSLGQFPGRSPAEEFIRSTRWRKQRFEVDKICLISRSGRDEPFEVEKTVLLWQRHAEMGSPRSPFAVEESAGSPQSCEEPEKDDVQEFVQEWVEPSSSVPVVAGSEDGAVDAAIDVVNSGRFGDVVAGTALPWADETEETAAPDGPFGGPEDVTDSYVVPLTVDDFSEPAPARLITADEDDGLPWVRPDAGAAAADTEEDYWSIPQE